MQPSSSPSIVSSSISSSSLHPRCDRMRSCNSNNSSTKSLSSSPSDDNLRNDSSSSNRSMMTTSSTATKAVDTTTTTTTTDTSAVGVSIQSTTNAVQQEESYDDGQYNHNLYETAILLNNIGISLLQIGRYHPCPLPIVVEAIETFRDALLVMKSSLVQTSLSSSSTTSHDALTRYQLAWNRLQKYQQQQRSSESLMYDISTTSALPHITLTSSFEHQEREETESNESDWRTAMSSSNSILLRDLMYRYDDIVRRTTMSSTTTTMFSSASSSSSYCLVKIRTNNNNNNGVNNGVPTLSTSDSSSCSNYGRNTAIILYNYGIAYLEYYNYSTAGVIDSSSCCSGGSSSNNCDTATSTNNNNNRKHVLLILKKADQLFQLSYDAYEDCIDVSSQDGEEDEEDGIIMDPTFDSTIDTIQNLVFGMMIVSNRYQLMLSMTSSSLLSTSISNNSQASFIGQYLLQEIYRLHNEVSMYYRYLQFDQQITKLFQRHAPAA